MLLNEVIDCVGWALASLGGRNPPAFGHCRFNSCPTHSMVLLTLRVRSHHAERDEYDRPVRLMVGRWVLSPATGVRFPYGSLQIAATRPGGGTGRHTALKTPSRQGMGVQVSPWLLTLRMGQCPAGSHKPCRPGATPGSATELLRLDGEKEIMPRFERGGPGSSPGRAAQSRLSLLRKATIWCR